MRPEETQTSRHPAACSAVSFPKGRPSCFRRRPYAENARSFYFLPDELYLYPYNAASVTHTICYDDYRADYSVESYTHDVLVRLGIFTEADFDLLRNHLLDALVIELKRICRFCSDRDHAAAALRSIRESICKRSGWIR